MDLENRRGGNMPKLPGKPIKQEVRFSSCHVCGGKGKIFEPDKQWIECPHCLGTGEMVYG